MKHNVLFTTLLVLALALTACGPAENENAEATSTPLPEIPTVMSGETPTVEMPEATSTESATSTEMAPSTTETAIVPVTGGETLLGVSQSDSMGSYLVDANGMTVYVYTKDTQNGTSSACTGDCATAWPPVTMSGDLGQGTPMAGTAEAGTPGVGTETPEAGAGTAVAGTPMAGSAIDPSLIGSITLPDGTVQLTYNGWPLYHYAQDVAPGDTNGQGKGGNWFIVAPTGEAIQK